MESSQRNYNFECDIQECSFPQISPFEYSVTLKSESYKELKYTWKVTKNTSVIENIKIRQDILSCINSDEDTDTNNLNIFKQLMELPSYEHIVNCNKAVNIHFCNNEKLSISNNVLKNNN